MKNLIIILLSLLPFTVSAQLLRSYGVVEIGSTFPFSTTTGAKFAYRTTDSSYYRWVSGNTWIKVIEPSIIPDTIYIGEMSGTTAIVNGDTINLTPYLLKSDTSSMLTSYINLAGWGLNKLGKTLLVDSSKVATRFYVQNIFLAKSDTSAMLTRYIERGDTLGMLSAYIRTAGWGLIKSPYTLRVDSTLLATRIYTNRFLLRSDTTSMLAPYVDGFGTATRIPIFTGSRTIGNSPILYNSTTKRTTWDSPGVIELPMGTDAQRPSPATTSDFWYNTTSNGLEWYNGTRWAKAPEFTFNRGTAGRIPFPDANGQYTESQYLTYTGTRFQTGGSIRFARNNSLTDTAQIEKVSDVNSKIVRINNPGDAGGWNSGFVFRGGANGVLSSSGTFRIYTNSSTIPGSVYVGNVSEVGAQAANSTTNLGVLNKITSTNTYDTGINLNPNGSSPNNFVQYSLANSKHFGIFIGGQGGTNQLQSMADLGYGVYAGYQYQPLTNGYGSSWVFVAKNDASTATEILRLQGKDGNICIGCTNASYNLQTNSTGAWKIPSGTTAQTPTESVGILRYNSDSTAYQGYAGSSRVYFATRAYARSLVAGLGSGTVTSVGLSLPSIFSVSGSPVTTSGTLSATFTGGSSSQFLRGDGRWMKSLYFNSKDSIQFNITDPYLGSTALISLTGEYSGFDSRFNVADYGYVNQALAISTIDDARYNFDRSRGTVASPSALLKGDRIGGIYFRAHNGSSYRKAGYIGAVVDSIHSGANPQSKLIFGTSEVDSPETSSYWRFLIEPLRNISVADHVTGASMGVGLGSNITILESATIDARFHVKGVGTTTGKTLLLEDSGGNDILTITDNKTIQAHGYGTGTKTAAATGKTPSDYIAGLATDGTVLDLPLGNRLSIQNGTLNTIRPTQDTFIQDIALFSVGTLLNNCNELVITTSMTSIAPSNMEIRFPDASDALRGKKITVYSSRKDAGAYVPYISVVGGVSRLFYTTNSSIVGTMPTSQATLYLDNVTWSYNGASYEWTCQKIDNTPSYRWVLNQR